MTRKAAVQPLLRGFLRMKDGAPFLVPSDGGTPVALPLDGERVLCTLWDDPSLSGYEFRRDSLTWEEALERAPHFSDTSYVEVELVLPDEPGR